MANLPVFRRWRRLDKVLTTLPMHRRFAWENFTSGQCHRPISSLMLIIRSLSTNNCRQAFVVFFYTSSMNSAVKLWQNCELEIFQECLLCYDQSQQISRHVGLLENHKLIYHLCLRLSFAHAWLSFFLQHMFQKCFWCLFGFVVCQ